MTERKNTMTHHPGRMHIFVPGPTNIPEAILNASHVSTQDYRGPEIPDFVLPLYRDVKQIFKTASGTIFIFPGSGTGAWESALTNCLSPGDKVLIQRFGTFSTLWADMCQRLGFEVTAIDRDWGTGDEPEEIERILSADKEHKYKAVCATHSETSTGVASDILGCRKAIDAANHPALFFVDAVSSLASMDFRFDEWRVDCAISGSQKGFMLPAGLSILAASERALLANKTARSKRCYFSWEDMIKNNVVNGYFPYTPSIPLLRALRVSVDMLLGEGLERVFKRHRRIAEGVRRAVKQGWKLNLCAREQKWESDTVSAVMVPPDIDARKIISSAYHKYHLSLGSGLHQLMGKAFRIGHLGDLNELQVAAALSGAEMAMRDHGVMVEPGSGAGVAGEYWRKNL